MDHILRRMASARPAKFAAGLALLAVAGITLWRTRDWALLLPCSVPLLFAVSLNLPANKGWRAILGSFLLLVRGAAISYMKSRLPERNGILESAGEECAAEGENDGS